jgi:hypothetical protein
MNQPDQTQRLLAAARRLWPGLVLYITYEPGQLGPRWEYRAGRHWLVLRGNEEEDLWAGIGAALVAHHGNYLGKGPCTRLPEHLEDTLATLCRRLHTELQQEGAP